MTAGALAVVCAIATATLAGAWTSWSLLEWTSPPGDDGIPGSDIGASPPAHDYAAPPQDPVIPTAPSPMDMDPPPPDVTDQASPRAGTGPEEEETVARAPLVSVGAAALRIAPEIARPAPTRTPPGAASAVATPKPPSAAQASAQPTAKATTPAANVTPRETEPAHTNATPSPRHKQPTAKATTPAANVTPRETEPAHTSTPASSPDRHSGRTHDRRSEAGEGAGRPQPTAVPSRVDGASTMRPSEQEAGSPTAEREADGTGHPRHRGEHGED